MVRLALLAVIGCVPSSPTVGVHVTDLAGQPLAGAVLAAACDDEGQGGAATTDADGLAVAEVYLAPKSCTVTVSLPRYDTVQVTDITACPEDHTCSPIEIALVQVVP